ncbi:hypothetical protein lerEdw1_020011 [Lerista edwardsae]|nr:hypothetical protein lerEdw1_020011 [Lerista edwardsae]
MADKEDDYENAEWLSGGETAPRTPAPPLHPKGTVPITPLLPDLFLLLGISLVTAAVLCVSHFGKVYQMFSEIQARLENISVSRAAVEGSYRDILGLASSGWRFYDRSMYFFSKDKRPWKEAEEACVLHGAHLTSVTSQKEMVSIGLPEC